MRYRGLTTFALIAASGLLGCGQGDSKGSGGSSAVGVRLAPPVDSDLAHLVPGDALGVVYAPSLDALEAKAKALVGAIDPEAAKELRVADILKDVLGPAFGQLDPSGPVLVAISAGGGDKSPPSPTFVVAVRDGAAAKKSFGELQPGQPAPVVRGRFLALSMAPGFVPSDRPSALVEGLLAGDVSIRLDLARVVSTFRKQIDEGLGQMSGAADGTSMPGRPPRPQGAAASADVMKSMVSGLRDFLNTAERLDLGIRVEGSVVNLDAAFTAKEGGGTTKFLNSDVDLASLAACLPKDYPIVALAALQFEDMMKWASKLTDAVISAMPENSRDSFRQMMAQANEMYALLEGGMAMGMSMGTSGIEGVTVVTAKDPKAFFAKWDEMLKGGPYRDAAAKAGAIVEESPPTTIAGVEVRGMTMRFDWQKMLAAQGQGVADPEMAARMEGSMNSMFGRNGFRVRTAAIGKRIVSVIGDDDGLMASAIAAAQNPTKKMPSELSSAMAKAGGKPSFLVRVELRSVIDGIGSMVSAMTKPDGAGATTDGPRVAPGAPIPLLLHGTADGRVYRGGLSVDVGAVVGLVKTMVKSVSKQMAPTQPVIEEAPVPSGR